MQLNVALAACLALGGQMLSAAELEIGWAERDVTPALGEKKVGLAGLYYIRAATNVHSRLKFTCCVMRQGDEQVLMGSLDTVSGWDPFTRKVAEKLHELIPAVRPESVFIGCPHVHSAPYLRPCYTDKAAAWAKKNPGFLTPDEYADFILEPVVDAFAEAWASARPGSVARAFGSARVGHCRIALYRDGTSEMYGDTRRADFAGLLEGEDDGVEMLFTCDASGRKTGVFVNAACPAQVMEMDYVLSSDFSGALREKLAREYGADFRTIYQLGPAGDQSPRDLVRPDAGGPANGWNAATVEVLSDRLVTCVKAGAAEAAPSPSVLSHRVRKMRLPIRRVSGDEVAAAKAELARLEAKWPGTSAWDDYLREVRHYERTGDRLPYDSKLHPYAVMDVDRAVLARAATQDAEPLLDVESHVVRIGDVAFVSNPFELYLAYGRVIKARSAAKQTFLVGKCGSSGYVPTEKSEKVGGYSGGVNVGKLGHEGAFRFCDEIVDEIGMLFGRTGAAADARPPLFMIRLRGPHTADDAQWAKTFKALTENPGCCDEVWFSTGIGLPKLEAHRAHAGRLCRYAAQLRAKGVVPSLQVQATLGHSDKTTALEPVDAKAWGGFTGRGGAECRYCSCPRQPGFLAYVREMAKLYAAFRPGSVWIDDDLRIAGHGPGSPWERVKDGWVGCWCPTCVAAFGRETGASWTRETLDAAMAKDPALFRRWVAFSYSSIAEVARTIAAAFHAVSPETRLALQHGSGFDADNLPVLKAMHEATGLPVGSRPGGGLYYDDEPMNQMLKPMRAAKKIRALGNPAWIYAFCPEVETFPRAFGSRTAQGLFNESLMSLACGMNSLSYLILDTRYETDAWASQALLGPLAGARTLLEGYRDFNADTVPAGLDVPDDVSADDALKLARLGIPVVTGVGRTYGAITPADCDVKDLGWTTSETILDLRRRMDARTGGKCPVFVVDPTVGAVVPRVDKAGTLKSVVLFNCRIDRQEPVRLRLRGVPADVRVGVWQAFRSEPTALALAREGDETLVTIPAVSAWNGGWLDLSAGNK